MSLSSILLKAKEIAVNVTAAEAMQADRDAVWVHQTMDALKHANLMGLVLPTEIGGMGQGLYGIVRVCEILGSSYSSAGLCYGMHCVGSAVLAAKATDWQKQQYLVPIAEGKHITTLALSEASTGAHFYFPQTTLTPAGEGELIVKGIKTFVTNGSHANSYVVSTMAATSEADASQFSCIVLDNGTKGMEWGKPWDGLGMRGNSSCSLDLDYVRIKERQVLGEKGDQLWYIFNIVAPYFLMAMAGTYLGIAAAAMREAENTIKKRTYSHNGVRLSSVPLLQHRIGTMWGRLEATRQLIYAAALSADRGEPESLPSVLAAKAMVADCAVDTVNEAMTLAGGIGYASNSYLGMLLRDARASHVMSPTTDLLFTWIGRTLMEQPLLSD